MVWRRLRRACQLHDVSVGALFGIGLVTGGVHGRRVLSITLSGSIPLPYPATCAAAVYSLLR